MKMIEHLSKNLIVLEIEKGIPIPKVNRTPAFRRKPKYRIGLDRLEVGDSVFIPESRQPPQREMHNIKMRLGWLYTFRIIKDDSGNVEGVRVWRVM